MAPARTKEPRSVQVIIYRGDRELREYLVLRRRKAGHEDFWQPVSGSLEAGESYADAARREAVEETGLRFEDAPREIGLVDRFRIAEAWRPLYAAGVTHNTQLGFALRASRGEVAIDSAEHCAFRWEPYSIARTLMRYAPNRRALDLVENGEERARRRAFRIDLPRQHLHLGHRTLVMGVLNVTPDSFSDGGSFVDPERAVERALEIESEGADIIDVGGESSRPGADPVSLEDELARVIPIVETLSQRVRIPISVDTTKAATARRAIDAGAQIVNDISALRFDPDMAAVVARSKAALVLMHMRGTPSTMMTLPPSADIFAEIETDMLDALVAAVEAGVDLARCVLDPGIGFGKTIDQNVELVARLDRIARMDRPLLVGTSRKSFLGRLTDRETTDRLAASLASVTAAVLAGAHIVRVHDVRASVDAVRVADAILSRTPR